MIRRRKQKGVFYARRPEFEIADEKLAYLDKGNLRDIAFDEIRPDGKQNWINLAQNDFDSFIPTAAKNTKFAIKPGRKKQFLSYFHLAS